MSAASFAGLPAVAEALDYDPPSESNGNGGAFDGAGRAEADAGHVAGLGAGPADSLRLLTCGSVDDGKSTLIGRLLWDASDLHEDQRAQLMRGNVLKGGQPDFSQLVDGLAAEREQGITIDIAWRYFDTAERRYVIIDSPGHEQYTRNMASGASHADVAIMLTDARHGVKRQTRRHAAILDLMGVKQVILAVNKMDLVDWSRETFEGIENDFRQLAGRFGFEDAVAIPVAAVTGDNVAERSKVMVWYEGPTLLDELARAKRREHAAGAGFRFPVQMVLRDGGDFRGLAGSVASGEISVGDTIVDVLSAREASIRRIVTMDGDLKRAVTGQAVVIELDRDLDIARGGVLAGRRAEVDAAEGAAGTQRLSLEPVQRVSARLVWLSEEPYHADAGYLLKTATDLVPISQLDIQALLNLETLEQAPSDYSCQMNDIALAEIRLGRPAVLEAFRGGHGIGNFMIVDALSGASVAGGIVVEAFREPEARAFKPGLDQKAPEDLFDLDDALLTELFSDLGSSAADNQERVRRRRAVVSILAAAGVRVAKHP